MTINKTSLLPEQLSKSELHIAMKIVAQQLEEKNDGFKEQYQIDLNDLFDYLGGNGEHPSNYQDFLQWLVFLLLKPKNAKAMQRKYKGGGRIFLEKLISFFQGVTEDGEQNLNEWLIYRNCRDYQRDVSAQELREWWRDYVNPKQQIIH